MSTLNLALQSVSLARTSMPDRFEELVQNKHTLAQIRECIMKCPELSDVLRDSMAQPLMTVGRRFQPMKVKGNPIKLSVPVNEAQITEQFQHALFVDPSLSPSDLTAKSLKKAEAYQKFIKSHCHSSQYIFQIKMCSDATCFYCLQHPVRLPADIFKSLSFLPLPLLDDSKEHYQKFSELSGQAPSDKDRPYGFLLQVRSLKQ